MESVYYQLVNFDQAMELYTSNLFTNGSHSPFSSYDLMSASTTPSRRQASKVADTESTHRNIEAMVEKWMSVIKKLPEARQHLKQLATDLSQHHEERTRSFMEQIAQHSSKIVQLEQVVDSLKLLRWALTHANEIIVQTSVRM